MREVWVTGAGAVTAAGSGSAALLDLLRSSRSALDARSCRGRRPMGRSPEPPRAGPARRLDRGGALFLAAAGEAWVAAELDRSPPRDASRCSVIEGTGLGSTSALLEGHDAWIESGRSRRCHAANLVTYMPGSASAALACALGIRGEVWSLAAGSASGLSAIGAAYQRIRDGAVDVAVAGAGESPLHPLIEESFASAGILAAPDDEGTVCRPFDARRTGTLLGEGAGCVILEDALRARARGARPLGRIDGFALACEAVSMTAPDVQGVGVTAAVRGALDATGRGGCGITAVAAEDLGWIVAHGTATRSNDLAEVRGLSAVLGSALVRIPITASKGVLGHCLGAAGAIDVVAAILCMREGLVHAIVTAEIPDPELPSCLLALRPLPAARSAALILAESLGGRCAALILSAAGRCS